MNELDYQLFLIYFRTFSLKFEKKKDSPILSLEGKFSHSNEQKVFWLKKLVAEIKSRSSHEEFAQQLKILENVSFPYFLYGKKFTFI